MNDFSHDFLPIHVKPYQRLVETNLREKVRTQETRKKLKRSAWLRVPVEPEGQGPDTTRLAVPVESARRTRSLTHRTCIRVAFIFFQATAQF